MCGIAGIIDPTGAAIDGDVLRRMTRALAPRGPDGEGFWFAPGVGLGHRRLSVIDLSAAGTQPMGGEDGAVQVTFNGEIYNFSALVDELSALGHRFHSRSDTEVLVHGYEEWGERLLDRIDGMFAFAIWDGRRRRLFAARDRMGKKPFYWASIPRDGGRPPLFAFASELKALLPVPGLDRAVDLESLGRYLTFEYVPAPRAIIKGARKLDAAESLTLDLTVSGATGPGAPPPVIRRYWALPFPDKHAPRREEEAAEELRMLLTRAVKRRLVSDVPLGVFLSGGIDSSTVVALMAAAGGHGGIKSFSIGFSDASFDETSHARTVARQFGTEHREDRLTPQALLGILPEVMSFLDEPLADASIIPTFLLARFTRQHVTVALGGDGGDELFAGYPTFKAEKLARDFYDRLPRPIGAMGAALVKRAAALLPAGTDYFSLDFKLNQFLRGVTATGPRRHQRWMASFLPEEQVTLLSTTVLQQGLGDPLSDVDPPSGPWSDGMPEGASRSSARDSWDVIMNYYCRFYLAGDINVKVDRATSAVGLEARAPFLDTDVVSFACALPPELRMQGTTTKRILKTAMRGVLPDEILDRPKQGFGVPVARWMKEDLLPMLREELHPQKIRREGFFAPDEVTRILDEHVSGRHDHRKQLWTLLVFEKWLANYGQGT
ncbi:MAG: asparagine synthase (glutamine-hydrolyzing) [Deltaproteobacteria bacterium]|nr:asparagine synthase (glutamine-hydrolyzing) [Deltaproteobacteria bacterium]